MLSSRLKVSDASIEQDWDELISSYWQSWATPSQAVGKLTFPYLGTGTAAEENALKALKISLLEATRYDPDVHWLKVTDTATDPAKIVAGGMWKIHSTNPYRAPMPRFEATWFPVGSEMRRLAEAMYERLYAMRPKMMSVAHACGNALWALPEYRNSGAGPLLMERWLDTIDQLRLEAYLEGTPLSTKLYQRFGFVVVSYVDMEFKDMNPNPSEEWTSLTAELRAQPISIMWRPVCGHYEEGKTIIPWEGKPRMAKL